MKPKLILIGGGGHCKSCIDVIEQENKFIIAGIVDINTSISDLLGYPMLGNDADLVKLKLSYDYALITTGQIKTPDFQTRLHKVTNPYGEGGASAKVVNTLKHCRLEGIIKKTFYDLPINSNSGTN